MMPNDLKPDQNEVNQDRTLVQEAVGYVQGPSIIYGGPGASIGAFLTYGFTEDSNVALIIGGVLLLAGLFLDYKIRRGR